MPIIKALSPAKLNLTFEIKSRRGDDYHEVETLMQAVDLYDELTFDIESNPSLDIAIECVNQHRFPTFPLDQSNLINRAARLFFEYAHLKHNARVRLSIEKNIPIGAGLAGGSSNAAATLVVLNLTFGNPLTDADILKLAGMLGADVPFCIAGGTQIGTGRGEVLWPVPHVQKLFFCIAKPRRFTISTPWAYSEFDKFTGQRPHSDVQGAIKALNDGDFEAAIKSLGNDFEPLMLEKYPEIAQLKRQLLDLGAWCCQLSGSGPALFALVADREMAHSIRRKVMRDDDAGFAYGSSYAATEFGPPIDFFIAESIPSGVQVLKPALAHYL